MAGYIKLHRGWRDTDGLLPSAKFSDFEAWLWLLENCAWKPIARWNAKGEEIRLNPGQIHVSIRSLTTAWGWSRKAVTTFLARLERVQKVRLSKGQSGTILTICNWAKYQSNGDSQGDGQEAGRGTVGGQSGDTQEEGKEGKAIKNTTSYAFAGRVIRLTAEDLRGWEKRYSAVGDIQAELGSLDDWLSGQEPEKRKKWFHIVSASLNKKHQAALRSARNDEEELPIC